MGNFELDREEVILEEREVTCSLVKGTVKMTLTSKKVVFEKQKGLLKKELELIDILSLEELKYFNGIPQISRKGHDVTIQTVAQNCTISFMSGIEARLFLENAMDAITGTTIVDRGASTAKGAFDVMDDVLGMDTRETIKGVVQDGLKGVLWNGLGKKK